MIEGYLELLGDRDKLFELMRTELLEIKEQFATPRRTEIVDNEFEQDIEDLIQREDMAVTVTHGGYVKRVPVSAYRAQRRGGKGRSGMATREGKLSADCSAPTRTRRGVLFEPRHRLQASLALPLGKPQQSARLRQSAALGEGETISASCRCPRTRRAGRRSM